VFPGCSPNFNFDFRL